jgi:hypothetical protein
MFRKFPTARYPHSRKAFNSPVTIPCTRDNCCFRIICHDVFSLRLIYLICYSGCKMQIVRVILTRELEAE